MKRSIFAAATLTLAACGGTSIGPGGLAGSSSCSVILSGARTGTYDCKSMIAVWDSSKNQSGLAFSVTEAGTTPGIIVSVGFPGEPHTGTFAQGDAGASGGLTVSISSGASPSYWIATADPASAQGTYSLKLSGVSTTYTASSGKTYNTAGTLDATLPAASGSGATGTIQLHAAF